MKMKNLVLALMMVMSISKTSSAGVGLIMGNPAVATTGLVMGIVGGGAWLGAESIGYKDWGAALLFGIGGLGVGYAGVLVLDADGSVPTDLLVEGFSKSYPFVDNGDSLRALAASVKSKIPSGMVDGESALVWVSESEVRQDLQSSDLTEVQIQKVVRDLGAR